MSATPSPDHVAAALALRDLTDSAQGTHAAGLLLDAAVDALATRWGSTVRVLRSSPAVSVEDNYDRLGYPASALTREARYSRYLGDTVLARTPHEELPAPARARLGTGPGQVNLLLRLVLRPLGRTLTGAQANVVRDRVYAALHEGPHHEWAGLPERQQRSTG